MVVVSPGTFAEPLARPVTEDPGAFEAAIRIEYYTDPLCCWSWALEPVWRQIRRRYGAALSWSCVLGGMIESWATFKDPLNDIGRPAQIAPLWHMAGRAAGVAIDPAIWHLDPPASSYPASVAVKAAALQGTEAGERYLLLVREGVMTRRLNVARRQVLLQLGDEMAAYMPGRFDVARFAGGLAGPEARGAFTADLQRVRFLGIGRFPTIVAHGVTGSRMAVGYRPADVMERMLLSVSGEDARFAGGAGERAG